MIVCRIVAGLGEVGWILNIESEIKRIFNGKVTTVFWAKKGERYENAMRFLERFKEAEHIDDLEKLRESGVGRDKTCIHSKDISNKEINGLQKMYDVVITFMMPRASRSLIGGERLDKEVIDFTNYGNAVKWGMYGGGVKMFLKDYSKEYGSGVNENEGYAKVQELPYEFSKRVEGKQMGEFRSEHMRKLIPSEPYYFTYLAYTLWRPNDKMEILEYFCKELYEFVHSAGILKESGEKKSQGGVKTMTVLTNLDVGKYVGKGGVSAGESESIAYMDVMNVRAKLVHYEELSPCEFEYALLRSERVVGCTGDMSMSQVLSSGRVPIYECLDHNEDFLRDLVQCWGKATDQTDPEKTFKTKNEWKEEAGRCMMACFSYYPEFWSDYRKFVGSQEENSFQKLLYDEILLRMMRKLEGKLKMDKKLQYTMQTLLISFDSRWADIGKVIEELTSSGNDIGAYVLREKRIPLEMLSGIRISRLRECIEDVIEKMSGCYNKEIECILEKYLGVIDRRLIEIGRILVEGDGA